MVCERPPRSPRSRLPLTRGRLTPAIRTFIFPLVRGKAAEGGRGSLTHHLAFRSALPRFLYPDIKCKAAVLIADPADIDAWCSLVFKLHYVALRRRCVGRECDIQIGGNTLLDRDARAWISPVAVKERVDRELGNADEFFDSVRHLTTYAGSDH